MVECSIKDHFIQVVTMFLHSYTELCHKEHSPIIRMYMKKYMEDLHFK